jgi:hypothetical protein
MPKTAKQFWQEAERHSASINRTFLELWNHPTNPMTKEDLAKNIERRPTLWSRFKHYLKEDTNA